MPILLALALLSSLVPAVARAQAEAGSARLATPQGPPDESARPMFEAGRRAFEAGRHAEALDAFQRVFVLTGHPAMLINIANAHAHLGEHRRAAASLEQYLALFPGAGDRAAIETRIAELSANPDSVALPPPPPAPAPAPPPTARAAPAPAAAPGLIAGRTFTWVALGTSLAFTAAAALVWLDANQQFERLALTCGAHGTCTESQLEPVSDSVTATNGCLAGAGLSLAAAVALFFLEAPDAPEQAPRLTASFDGQSAALGVRGRL